MKKYRVAENFMRYLVALMGHYTIRSHTSEGPSKQGGWTIPQDEISKGAGISGRGARSLD